MQEIIKGLQSSPKTLPTKYLYDQKGSELFQEIMHLEEYYLPRCELEIIEQDSSRIAHLIKQQHHEVDVVELGAGDGTKTLHMLKDFVHQGLVPNYYALDISPDILQINKQYIHQHLPSISIYTVAGDYYKTLPRLVSNNPCKLLLFLGGNIGNFPQNQVMFFFQWMKEYMQKKDSLIVAFDLKKPPHLILDAYNDGKEVTAKFQLNLLTHLNAILEANFKTDYFSYFPAYNPLDGTIRSYLISLRQQKVTFNNAAEFHLAANEPILTEVSKKYSVMEIDLLAKQFDLKVTHFMDSKNYYCLSFFQKLS